MKTTTKQARQAIKAIIDEGRPVDGYDILRIAAELEISTFEVSKAANYWMFRHVGQTYDVYGEVQ